MAEQETKKRPSLDELEDIIRTYHWLKEIAESYKNSIELMDKEKDYFDVYAIIYSARSDPRKMEINPHRTIPVKYLRDGLQEALDGVLKEIEEMESLWN